MLRRTTSAGRVWRFGVAVIAIALFAAAAWGHNGLSGPAAAWAQEGTTDTITVLLGVENDSGQSGKMTLTTQDADTNVILTLPQDSGQSKLAHIHFGQCPSSELGNTVFGLANIDATGTSITLLEGVSIAELLTGNLAVNTHDAEDSTIATACGSIPAKANPTNSVIGAAGPKGDPGPAGTDGDTGGILALAVISMVLSIVAVAGFAFLMGRRTA